MLTLYSVKLRGVPINYTFAARFQYRIRQVTILNHLHVTVNTFLLVLITLGSSHAELCHVFLFNTVMIMSKNQFIPTIKYDLTVMNVWSYGSK